MKKALKLLVILILSVIFWSCCEKISTVYEFSSDRSYIQRRRVGGDPNPTDFGLSWLEMTADGQPIEQSDIGSIHIYDSLENEMVLAETGYRALNYYINNCTSGICDVRGPIQTAGFYAAFTTLPDADMYTVVVETADGQTLNLDIDYPGAQPMPIANKNLMDAKWVAGDLKLTWTNMTEHGDYDTLVDYLRIVFYDDSAEQNIVLYNTTGPDKTTITIPADLYSQAEALAEGGISYWQVQTVAIDPNGMDYAVGHSVKQPIPAYTQPVYEINSNDSYIQTRTVDGDPNPSVYALGWLQMTIDDQPVEQSHIESIRFFDSIDNEMVPAETGFRALNYYINDCTSGTCDIRGPNQVSGFYAAFNTRPAADTYAVVVETACGQTLDMEFDYPGIQDMPVAHDHLMNAHWDSGDLVLNWTNMTENIDYDTAVTYLRIVLYDGSAEQNIVLYNAVGPHATTITIPAALYTRVYALAKGSVTHWQVQTVAIDANGMDYAVGYSVKQPLPYSPPPVYTFDNPYVSLRSFPAGTNNYVFSWIEMTVNGRPIEAIDIDEIRIVNSSDTEIPLYESDYISLNYVVNNCISGICSAGDPVQTGGFYSVITTDLQLDTYTLEIDTADGQELSADIDFPGPVAMPIAHDLDAQWSEGDLELSWINDTGNPNYDQVNHLRVVLLEKTDNRKTVLYTILAPSASMITIPAELYAQVEALADGGISGWEVRTIAYDTDGMNYAAGFSDQGTIPAQ